MCLMTMMKKLCCYIFFTASTHTAKTEIFVTATITKCVGLVLFHDWDVPFIPRAKRKIRNKIKTSHNKRANLNLQFSLSQIEARKISFLLCDSLCSYYTMVKSMRNQLRYYECRIAHKPLNVVMFIISGLCSKIKPKVE
jgi:hypothetical protein